MRLQPDRGRILALEGIEEMSVPEVERNLHEELQQDDADEVGRKREDPSRLVPPENRSGPPEPLQQLLVVGNEGVLLVHVSNTARRSPAARARKGASSMGRP